MKVGTPDPEVEKAKAYAKYAAKMHRQLLKVEKQLEAVEKTISTIRSRKERAAINKRLKAFMDVTLRENLQSRKAKQFASVLEVSAVDMQVALLHAQSAIASYISTWNDTLDAARSTK